MFVRHAYSKILARGEYIPYILYLWTALFIALVINDRLWGWYNHKWMGACLFVCYCDRLHTLAVHDKYLRSNPIACWNNIYKFNSQLFPDWTILGRMLGCKHTLTQLLQPRHGKFKLLAHPPAAYCSPRSCVREMSRSRFLRRFRSDQTRSLSEVKSDLGPT